MPSNYVLTPAAVRKVRRLLAHPSGNTGATLRSATISPDEFPPPFAVRWSASETSGGTWTIWLPDRAKLVAYGDAYVATITGVAACQNLPTGYYTVAALSASSTSVYLNVTITDATGSAAAELSDAAGTASSGETVYSILVATMATDANTGAKLVKQFVDSAVLIGKGGEAVEPDNLSTELAPSNDLGTEGKLQIKYWDDPESGGAGSGATSLAEYIEDPAGGSPSQALDDVLLVARDSGLIPSTRYIPVGKLAKVIRATDNALKVVTAVEWLQGNGPVGHEYSIRVSKQKIIIANGELTLDAVKEYSYIDTVAHSAVYPNGN